MSTSRCWMKSAHLSFLDAFGGKRLQEKRAQVATLYGEWRKTRTELEHLLSDAAERERRTDMLRYQVNEIDTAKLRLGEEEELERQQCLLPQRGKDYKER